LLGEVIEKLDVIHEIAFEQSSRLFQTAIEPFHSYLLPELWSKAAMRPHMSIGMKTPVVENMQVGIQWRY